MRCSYFLIVITFLMMSCIKPSTTHSTMKESLDNNLIQIYIPKSILNSYKFDEIDSDVLYDTINKYTYYSNVNFENSLSITTSENWTQESLELKVNSNLKHMFVTYPNFVKLLYSSTFNFNKHNFGINNYLIKMDSFNVCKWVIFCNSKSRNKQIKIIINYNLNDSLAAKLKDSIPKIISSIELN